jgi:hypothetical protein
MISRTQRGAWFLLVTLMLSPASFADSIRVTTWSLNTGASGAPGTNETRVAEVAATLKKLDPDVILLQGVPDWKTCDQLVLGLKPSNYSVLVCSAFRNGSRGGLSQNQVAILSKRKAYFSWTEAWLTSGDERALASAGFAFAAMQIGSQRLGFYSLELPAATSGRADARLGELPAPKLLAHARSVRSWEANQVEAMVLGGGQASGARDSKGGFQPFFSRLAEAGFGEASGESGVRPADFLLTEPSGWASPQNVGARSENSPVTYILDLDPAKIAAARASAREQLSARAPGKPNPRAAAESETLAPPRVRVPAFSPGLILAIVMSGLIIFLGVAWTCIRWIRRPLPSAPRLLAENCVSSSYTVVVGTQSATGQCPPAAGSSSPPQPVIHLEAPGTTNTHAQALQLRPATSEHHREPATEALRAGLIAELSRWLKQRLLRKLIADRLHLVETQRAAALKASAVEDRLARLEHQIQRQNMGYQQRIEDLTRALIAAKEENRDLIRAQIRQVKAEMEAARARVLAEATENDAGTT